MNLEQLIKSYLEKSLLLQVATSANNIPWVCTVCFAYDLKFNLYWFSRHSTRHSQEIANNPQVAGVVALPYSLGDKPIGLQFAGTALELNSKKEITSGLNAMQKRYGVKDERIHKLKREILLHRADYGLYCLRPGSILLYDTLNFPDSPRQVYEVGEKIKK